MLDHKLAGNRIVSPIVNERIRQTIELLGEKISGAGNISCTVKHVAREIFEVVITVEPNNGKVAAVFARKSGKSIFAAIGDAQKAILRQLSSNKGKIHHRRHEEVGESSFPLTG